MAIFLSCLIFCVFCHRLGLFGFGFFSSFQRFDNVSDHVGGEDSVSLASNTTGDIHRLEQEIKSISEQMVALRNRLSLIQSRVAANEKVNAEVEKIKELLTSDTMDFTEFSDTNIRRMTQYIRAKKEGKIIINLKGGVQIEENMD